MPAISIVVPIYNVERYLDECLSSIERQTFSDLEIICVNDGSTDSSLSIAEAHAARDPRIRVIDKPNAGYGHTINRGIAEAAGEYLGIVESDDFIEPDMFERLHACVKAGDLDIARVNYWLYWSRPEPRDELFEAYRRNLCGEVFDPRDEVSTFFFPPALWAMLVRRELIVEHGLRLLETPGASYQDTSFSFKLWSCAKRAELIYEPYLHYRQDNEASSINNKQKANQVCVEYAEIERFIQEDARDMSLMPIAQRRKYDAYLWNLGRIDESLRAEFAVLCSREFGAARDKGWYDRALFSDAEWRELTSLIDHPKRFLARYRGARDNKARRFLKRIYHKLIR